MEKEKHGHEDGKECNYRLDNFELDTNISIDDDEENEEKQRRPVLANIVWISNHFHK